MYYNVETKLIIISLFSSLRQRFTVLCGKAELKSSEIHEHFGAGDVFSIPPNVKYSLKNESSEPCYLNFFSYPQNADDPKWLAFVANEC